MASTWIFQGNPARFNIDAFLASPPPTFTWSASQNAGRMEVGDTVYLWRALGPDKDPRAGLVAEAVITEKPSPRSDSGPSAYWVDPSDGTKLIPRAVLALVRVAKAKEIIKRDWLKRDPILKDLLILRMANGTNFIVEGAERERLEALWKRTGRDWTYAETVGGLWAYKETLDISISEQPGSPVSRVALMLGRTVGGVYNKVMNFRAIDPTDTRTGLAASSEMDDRVWSKFYEPGKGLRAAALDEEFESLWPSYGSEAAPFSPIEATDDPDEAAHQLARKYTLEELLARFAAGRQGFGKRRRSSFRSGRTRTYDRNPLVIAIAKVRAGGRCEVPACQHPTFLDADGVPYVEVHHIEPLSEGGPDTPENVACVCPAHHREAHLGAGALQLARVLRELREDATKPVPSPAPQLAVTA